MDGQVLGFWAFGIASDHLDDRKLVSVGRFARDISELLYQRQQVREADSLDRRRWLDYLTLQGGRSLARDLKAALGVTTKRLRVIEDLFQRSKSGYLLYDAFGQLLLDNPPAAHLCQELGLQAYDLNYTDTLSYLSGLDLEAAKTCLQRVVLDGESVSLPLNSRGRKDLAATLTVTAIAGDDPAHGEVIAPAESSSLTLSGVFIEIRPSDGSSDQLPLPPWLDQVFAQQGQLLQRLTQKLTGSQSELAVAPEIANASTLAAHAHRYLHAIESGVLGDSDVAPFDQILDASISNQDKLIRQKRLIIEPRLPACQVLALVPSGQLTKLLDDLLNIAVDDAKRGSTLQIIQQENWPWLHLSICSDGIGIPARRLDDLMTAQTSIDRGSSLPRCKAIAEQAGGTLAIASEVGRGTSFDLRLPAVPVAGDG
jgi:signal transduction histidine kinase